MTSWLSLTDHILRPPAAHLPPPASVHAEPPARPVTCCREARKIRLETLPSSQDILHDNLVMQLKRTADGVRSHPFRVHDAASALEIKGCGPAISREIGRAHV